MLYKACLLYIRNVTRLDVIWMKLFSSGVSFYLSTRSCAVSSQLCLHETIDYSLINCFMNIKMKSNIINVETSFRHANHSAAFVYGKLLRFLIPKFHLIPVTCWCLLPSDLVNTSYSGPASRSKKAAFALPWLVVHFTR